MHRRDGKLIVSATDLVGFLECGHLTQLDRAAVAGQIHKPDRKDDPAVELLRRRGGEHEDRYLEKLAADGRSVVDLSGSATDSYERRAALTLDAMQRGDDVIYQGAVFNGRWIGFPDFLLRVDTPTRKNESAVQSSHLGDSASPSQQSDSAGGSAGEPRSAAGARRAGGATGLGHDWHYEVADTKLARSAKASALIQMCSYVDQVTELQGVRPEQVYVVTGGATIEVHAFRTAEMMAYYRRAKARFEAVVNESTQGIPIWPIPTDVSYPDPVDHCAVCRWIPNCIGQWRRDDALPLVAGIGRDQRKTLNTHDIRTMKGLSELTQPLRLDLKPSQDDSMWRMREQARLQVASREAGKTLYEFLDPETDTNKQIVPNRGLAALPLPSDDDLFFDIEGDPFAFWEGLEYLFGIWDGAGYRDFWAMNRVDEKQRFQQVMDLFYERWRQHRDMHVYHYGAYEPSRLKSLAGRHATKQEQLDELLTAGVFVDLYRVVRQGLRVGSDQYSIKNLESLYGFTREIELRDANSSIVEFEKILEIGDPGDVLKTNIAGYNKDDCESTQKLRDWLEERRVEAATKFGQLPRPRVEPETQPDPPTAWEVRLAAVTERLTAGVTTDPVQVATDPFAEATWLLANLLDFHRREEKAGWWRFFELMTFSDDELLLEHEPIARLRYEGVVDVKKNGNKVHRYRFPVQEHRVGNRSDLFDPRLPPFEEGELGKGIVDKEALTLDLTRAADWNGPHPTSVVPHDRIPIDGLQDGLERFGLWVAEHGLGSTGDGYRAIRDLLMRKSPRVVGRIDTEAPLKQGVESGTDAACRLATKLDGTTLAIQGPPGSGKTYSGARMILELLRDTSRRRRIGITGSGHKVIKNLLDELWEAAAVEGMTFEALQRIDSDDDESRPWAVAKDNGKFGRMLAAEDHDYRVIAGTVWLWARDEMADSVDTLFVDEAGQISLASVVAAGGAARNIVLLGDPQQLDQVLQGSHPPGAEQPALGHFLDAAEVVSPADGVFLEKTWRMHPEITAYTSELFYQGELDSIRDLEGQRVIGAGDWSGSGLRWVPVKHAGNSNASREEAAKVVEIVRALLDAEWVDREGRQKSITADEIRVVSPYNAHRLLIDAKLAEARLSGVPVGTVDKFQGQEAAVSIYTMASSTPEEAPRGLNFLYSLNRLNVATSRARALAIVIASPELLRVIPKSPQQLRMANGLAAFVEMAAAVVRPAPAPVIERPPDLGRPAPLVMGLG
jgi:predicted RecB family nuclease